MPMMAARRRYSPTVDRLTPVVMAICRSLTPRACRNLRTSRTFRIGALSAGIGPPLAWPQRGARPRFDRRHRELHAGPHQGGRLRSEWVAGFRRNQWPACIGISGRFASDYAVTDARPASLLPRAQFSFAYRAFPINCRAV